MKNQIEDPVTFEREVDVVSKAVFNKLAGVGIGDDPEECLLTVADRLVERDGRMSAAETLRSLADEIYPQPNHEKEGADEES